MSDKRLEDDRLKREDENILESQRLGRITGDLQHGAGSKEGIIDHDTIEDQVKEDIGMQGNVFNSDTGLAEDGDLEELKEDVGLEDNPIDYEK